MVVLANGDAAAAACGARVNLPCDTLAEDGEHLRTATAHELVVYPFGVMPSALAGMTC